MVFIRTLNRVDPVSGPKCSGLTTTATPQSDVPNEYIYPADIVQHICRGDFMWPEKH